jgi:uncharacterized LabA/DUF88 family protein
MADNDTSLQTALLIDLENLVIPFEKKGADPVRIAPIVDFLESNFGNVIVRRAYADWSHASFKKLEAELQDLGVEMIHVKKRSRHSKKNGADILLTADAVECLLLRPHIDVFGIVSGDSDIGPLVTKLRAHGKTVVVIGPDKRSTAMHVIELADRFKYYQDVAGETTPKRSHKRGVRSPDKAVTALLAKEGRAMESALLKRRLLEQPGFSNFSEKSLGFKSWTDFLRSLRGVRVIRHSDLGIEVELDR